MKVQRQLAALEPLILGPVRGVNGEDWHRRVPGKWSLAQIIRHVAIGVDYSATTFEGRAARTDMRRRSTPGQAIMRHLILGLGKFPKGREAPAGSVPEDRPDAEAAVAQVRMGIARFEALVETWPQERWTRIFVKHPVLGDLNLPEWIRFHYVHCRHHSRQIQARLRWLRAQRATTPEVR
ncbi:MAG TPA: DinB family protein [Gemmatimonadales bacterium]|nr:DinB family protein [Gemmatimonadales bacterium]